MKQEIQPDLPSVGPLTEDKTSIISLMLPESAKIRIAAIIIVPPFTHTDARAIHQALLQSLYQSMRRSWATG